jgi:aspartyl/asparaginyl-tRNA synthetase
MMDAETAFCDNDKNMEIQEDLIYFVIQEVLRVRREELEIL